MKRIILLFMVCQMALMAWTQAGLNINALFDGRYQQSPSATEILVQGTKAHDIGLDIYRSLTITDMAQTHAIEEAVTRDGAKATAKEVEYRGGQLYYGFYVLGTVSPGMADKAAHYRYVFYLNQSLANKSPLSRVTVIYMESKRNAESIKRLIKK